MGEVLVDEHVLVMEAGGFDMESWQGGGVVEEALLGCNVGSIESGSRGLLGRRLFCQGQISTWVEAHDSYVDRVGARDEVGAGRRARCR
jgi:hypothetical protein